MQEKHYIHWNKEKKKRYGGSNLCGCRALFSPTDFVRFYRFDSGKKIYKKLSN